VTRSGHAPRFASQQFFHCNWQIAHSLAGRVIDRIGNGRRYRYGGEFAKALDAMKDKGRVAYA
jgi:hypothetical protein